MTRLLFALHFVLFSCFVPQLQAQGSVQKDIESAKRFDALAGLTSDDRVRILAARTGRTEGQFLRVTDNSLYILGDQAEHQVAIAEIDELWVQGRATKKGALIGAAAGGGTFALLGGWFGGAGAHMEGGSGDAVSGFLGGFLLGAVLGGLVFGGIGAGVGALTSQWHCKYPQ